MANGNGEQPTVKQTKSNGSSSSTSGQGFNKPSTSNGGANGSKAVAGNGTSSGKNKPNQAADLFAEAFSKPTAIYRRVGNDHLVRPRFLKRNLWYMSPDVWLSTRSANLQFPWRQNQQTDSPSTASSSVPENGPSTRCPRPKFHDITGRMLSLAEPLVGTTFCNTLANGTVKLIGLDGDASGKFQVSLRLESWTTEKRKGRLKSVKEELGTFKLPLPESSKDASVVIQLEKAAEEGTENGSRVILGEATLVLWMERLDFDEVSLASQAKRLRLSTDAKGKDKPDESPARGSIPAKGPVTWSNGWQSCHPSVIPLAPSAGFKVDPKPVILPPPSRFYQARLPFRSSTGNCLLQPGAYEIKMEPVKENDESLLKGRENGGKEASVAVLPSGKMGVLPPMPGCKWKPAPQKPEKVSFMEKSLRNHGSLVMKIEFAPGVSPVVEGNNTVACVPTKLPQSLFQKALRDLTGGVLGKKKVLDVVEKRRKLMNEAPTSIYYRFFAEKRRLSLATVRGYPLECVFCKMTCATLYGLLKHCRLNHSRFIFYYAPMPDNVASIDVSINPTYDGSFAGNPAERVAVSSSGSLQTREGPRRCSLVTSFFVSGRKYKGPRTQPKPTLAEFFALPAGAVAGQVDANGHPLSYSAHQHQQLGFGCYRSFTVGHRRLYFRSVTIQPALSDQGVGYSDDENDPKWLRQKTIHMIDEFTDVNEGEKEIMKAWNLHKLRHHFTGDCHMDRAVEQFVQDKATWIVEQNLVKNFLCHLHTLLTHGLIRQSTQSTAMARVQNLKRKIDRQARERAMESAGSGEPNGTGGDRDQETKAVDEGQVGNQPGTSKGAS